jgi:hypothetical protein
MIQLSLIQEGTVYTDCPKVGLNNRTVCTVAYQGILFLGEGGGGSTKPVEDSGQTERGSGGGSPIVRGSAQFANEWNPYSYYVVTDYIPRNWEFVSVLSKFEVWGGGGASNPYPSVRH